MAVRVIRQDGHIAKLGKGAAGKAVILPVAGIPVAAIEEDQHRPLRGAAAWGVDIELLPGRCAKCHVPRQPLRRPRRKRRVEQVQRLQQEAHSSPMAKRSAG